MNTVTLSDRVETFFREDVERFTCGLTELDRCIDPNEPPRHDDRFDALLDRLDEIRAACRDLEVDLADRSSLAATPATT
jgi:hypothetical protein